MTEKTQATLPKSYVEMLPKAGEIALDLGAMVLNIQHLSKELEKVRKKGAIPTAKAFVVLHRLKDKMDAAQKVFTAVFEEYKNTVLPEMLEAEGVTSLPLAEGFRVGVNHRWAASIREGMKDQAYQWLREHKLDDIITSTINSSTLSATAKSLSEDDNIDLPDDLFNVAIIPNTSVTRTK